MGFSLKKLLEGAAADINIFDGGKSHGNMTAQPRNQPTRTPAQTPPPQSGNMNFAGSKTYGTFNRPSPVVNAAQKQIAQTPNLNTKNRYAQVNAPSYGSGLSGLLNRAKDVVDANTAQDRFKRTQIGQPEVVKPMQQQVTQIAKPMAQSIAKPFQQFGNALVEGNRLSYIDLPKAIAAQTSGNKQAMANINAGINQRLKGQGTFGAGMPGGFTSLEQGSKSFIQDPEKTKSMLGAGVQIGTTVAPMGKSFTLGSQVFSQPIKETGKTLLRAGGANAVLSGGGSAGMQLSDTGKIDLKQLAKDTAFGTVVGTGLPFVGGAANKGVSKAADPIQNALKNTGKALGDVRIPNPLPKNQIGAIGRNVNDSVDPLDALKAEAKKYKSADEFVKAQTNAYHGTDTAFDTFDNNFRGAVTQAKSAKNATFFTDNPDVAKAYATYAAENRPVIALQNEADRLEKIAKRTNSKEDWLKYDAVVAKMEDVGSYDNTFNRRKLANVKNAKVDGDFLEVDARGKSPQELSADDNIDSWLQQQIDSAKAQGKDGVKFTNLDDGIGLYDVPSTHYAVFDNSKIMTDKQLTDLYNQATKPSRLNPFKDQVGAVGKNIRDEAPKTKGVAPTGKTYVVPKTNSTDVTKLSEKDLQYFGKQGYTAITDKFGNTRQIAPVATDGVKKLDNLNPTGGVYVDYDPKTRATMSLADNITTLDKTAGKAPDELVTIYRGAPSNQKSINAGDFITTNKELAKSYTGDGNVLEMKVPASHILDDVDNPLGEEYLYRPTTVKTEGVAPKSASVGKTVEQTPFGPVSKVKKSGTPDQSPELEMQKTPQTQPNLSQATGKVDDLATGTEVSRAGKSGATAQNQTNLEPGNTYTSNKQQRGFKSNIAKDTETPLSVYKDIPGYNVKPNAKTIGSAAQRVAKDPEGTYNRLLENGIQKTDDSADALVLLRNLVENDELDKAGKLAKATAKAGTDFGQAVQIFSAFRKTTPDGALRDAWNIVNAYNAKNPKKTPIRITPEQTKKITDLANDLQNTEYGTREWAKKAALLEREKGLLTPNSFLSKVSTVQTMAQLLNPKTAIRNILGNGVLDLAEDISRLPAAGIDKALKGLGLIDERNMVLPNMKTNWANKLLGFKQGVEDVNLGIRTTGAAGNYDLTKEVFKPGSAGNKLEKLLGYELSSMDKAFFTGRYQSSLENMMKAQNVKVPTPEMKATAEAEALYATFQNNSNLSKALQKGKNAANFGKEWGLGDFILKYPKTPGNIVNVGLDYSPVGFVKGLKSLNDGIKLKNIQNIRNGELLLGRSLVGSGLIAGGAFLAKQGIISGKQDGDFDKSAADRDLGKGPFSFNITALGRLLKGEDTKARPGDITANYDWLQPNAIQLSMGANMVINNNSATQQINTNLESLGAGIDTISEQPVFRGVKDFVGDLNSQQGGGVGKAAQGVATNAFSSFVPSIVNQVGQQFDNTKRSSYSDTPVGEAVNRTKGRIPGARNTLYPSLNTLGEEQKQYDVGGNNPFNVFFNPAFLNRVKDSPALSMADELNQKTGETSQYPRSLTGKQTIDGTKTKLTPEQLFNLKKDVGQTTNSIFQQYASSPIFQNLSDTEKVNTLTNALTDINAAGKANLAAKNSLGQYAPGFTGKPTKLSSSQKALVGGEYNVDTKMAGTSIPKGLNQDAVKIIASYDKSKAKEASDNQTVTKVLTSWNNGKPVPQVTNEIAKQWADYEKGLKDGSLTKLEAKDQKIKILRNSFNSQLNDDERQLYKLSKTKITQALSEGLITEDNLKKALAVERQMFDNGLLESETLAKKLGLGSRSKSSGSSSRKSSGRKTSRAKSTKLKASKTPISFTKVKNRQKSVNSSLRKLLGSAKV